MGIGLGHLHHSLRVSVPLEINISLRRKVVDVLHFILLWFYIYLVVELQILINIAFKTGTEREGFS